MPQGPMFVGIDVAKAHLDIALRPTAEGWGAANDDTGIPPWWPGCGTSSRFSWSWKPPVASKCPSPLP